MTDSSTSIPIGSLNNSNMDKLDRAAGLLVLHVDKDQRVHLAGIEDDPIAMWKKLEEVHMSREAGTRFNAYDDLFSIRLAESESLSSLIVRVDEVMHRIKGLRPEDFDITKMDEELAIMAMIRALPQEQYGSFVSSFLLQKDLKKASVQAAFKAEETQRKPRSSPGVSIDSALRASFSASPSSSSKPKVKCDFSEEVQGSAVQSGPTGLSPYPQAEVNSALSKTEYAGNARFLSSSPSEPMSYQWLVDSGATSHMTPHRHWFHTFVPWRVPVRIANGQIIYSEGKGTPFPQQAENRHSLPLDLIFSDVHGPLPTQTIQGYRYWITFLDDATKFCYVVLLRKKNEAFQAFQIYKAYAENLLSRRIGTLRDNKGGEYISTEWDDCMKLHGIRREHIVRSTPQQNGAAERINRNLAEGVTPHFSIFPGLVVRESQLTESSPPYTVGQDLLNKILAPLDDSDDQDSVGALPQVHAGQPQAQQQSPEPTPSPQPEIKDEPLHDDTLRSPSPSQTPDLPVLHTNPSHTPSSSSSPSPFPVRRPPRRRKEPSPFTPPQPYPTDPAIRRSTRTPLRRKSPRKETSRPFMRKLRSVRMQKDRDRAKHSISLSQKHYVEDILERFHMSDCKPVGTPMEPGLRLSASQCPATDEDKQAMASVPYINAVGALMYLAIATRPDISFAVSVLSRFNSNPGPDHWKAVKHLFRYLKGTMDYKLTYAPLSSASKERFEVYSDADHGGNPDSGKSTSAYVVKMGTAAVSWSSKLSIVALSTTEAEYVSAVSEAIWIRQLLTELGYEPSGPTTLHMDNQSAIQVARNPEHHGRMKHLDLRFYWLRDAVENGTLSIDYEPTDSMAADILTKSLSKVKVEEACKQLGLESLMKWNFPSSNSIGFTLFSLVILTVQKDKRSSSLGSHIEKCVFIGYPPGYKGWKFYNPATRKSVISERAEFYERYYPGLKQFSTPSGPLLLESTTPSTATSHSPLFVDFGIPPDEEQVVPAAHPGGEEPIAGQPEPAGLQPDPPAALPAAPPPVAPAPAPIAEPEEFVVPPAL
ncbi:hypothetical protein NLI96_g12644 [Meripilus lineatus]|uniref:Integrase catalytic domain-containing protein n=1 Tax=Meripilus lineatus TaxID=2056292 RepID=A0AAD5UR87_9APHY|nr:hypothetical protein NLI96_g12644 [Physisporinus lineatus]